MATERKKSPLYDHEKPARKEEDAMMASHKGGGENKPERKEPAKEERPTGESGEMNGAGEMLKRHAKERAAVHKAHETERRDMHGNHRDEHRKMAERHEKMHHELNAKHMQEMMAAGPGGGPAGEGAAPEPSPDAGAAAAAAPTAPAAPPAPPAVVPAA